MSEEILVIDIEASGLDHTSYPIEVAIGNCTDIKNWLIKPLPHWTHWDINAEKIHGISREYLQEHGTPAKEVAHQIDQFLASRNGLLYSDADWWDSNWLDTLFLDTGTTRNYHVLSIVDLMEEFDSDKFSNLKVHISERDSIRLHRAANDVEIISKALKELEK